MIHCPEPSSLSLVVGSSYSESKIKSRIRDKEDPLKEFVISEKVSEEKLSDSGRIRTTYVFTPTSWHYGWRSSKHRKHQMHSLRIYLFIARKSKQLTLMALAKLQILPYPVAKGQKLVRNRRNNICPHLRFAHTNRQGRRKNEVVKGHIREALP